MKPTLSFPGGSVQPLSAEMLENFLALLHTAGIRRYLCDDTLMPRETVAEMLRESEALDPRGLGLWAILDESGGFIGAVGLQPVGDYADGVSAIEGGIEPIIALDPALWGKGMAHEVMMALVGYARDALALPRLVAGVDAPNTRSHALMRRCGFREVGQTPGPAHMLVLYGLEFGSS